ncbi:MAG: hypothetical protein LBR69_00240 [Endomicrobium sp.]|jgi:hypothetical protein|nr:hypothetical protein [Endomicrobium sp.]
MGNLGLFVITELLIAGFGAVIWIILFITAFSGKEIFDYIRHYAEDGSVSMAILIFLLISYILGIIIDRFMFWVSGKALPVKFPGKMPAAEKIYKDRVLNEDESKAYKSGGKVNCIKIEKFVRENLPNLAERTDYNKNRLIIIQSWALNSLLIFAALALNCGAGNFKILDNHPWTILITAFLFFFVMFIMSVLITKDYQEDLLCSLSLAAAKEKK